MFVASVMDVLDFLEEGLFCPSVDAMFSLAFVKRDRFLDKTALELGSQIFGWFHSSYDSDIGWVAFIDSE